MRVSVTLTDDVHKIISEQAKLSGMSKDKFIGSIIETYLHGRYNAERVQELINEKKELERMLSEQCQEVGRLTALLECKHNDRGAGRKAKFTDIEILKIKDMRDQGMSIRQIANKLECSVGLVHKLINE